MRGSGDLPKRQRDILVAVVRRFIADGVPVGSKALADALPEPLSSATIRNVMAELVAEGYLAQPHVSAGRIPTDRGYRYYVDCMASGARLAPTVERYIDRKLAEVTDPVDALMAQASCVLSEMSRNVGLALAPSLEEKLFEYIKFVTLPDRRVLALVVSKPERVESKVIAVGEEISQAELDRAAEFINSEFRGWSLRTIRLEVFKRLEEEKILYDRLLHNVATLFMWSAMSGDEPGPLFVDGTARILDRLKFEDVRQIRQLLQTFEEKAKLVKILSLCLQTPDAGVRILIGRENSEKQMQHCTLIVAPLHYRERAVGALGVVGPTRMEYDRAISAVDYIAHRCSQVLSSN
jgi:heat-inducible transcriptional repressor